MEDSTRSDALVLFGATGDLARKMVLPALYRMTETGRLDVPVTGVALSAMDTEVFRHDAVEAAVDRVDDDVMTNFLRRLTLVTGDYRDPATFDGLAAALHGAQHAVHYPSRSRPRCSPPLFRAWRRPGCTTGSG